MILEHGIIVSLECLVNDALFRFDYSVRSRNKVRGERIRGKETERDIKSFRYQNML